MLAIWYFVTDHNHWWHWHLQQLAATVIDTCSNWPPRSLTPTANDALSMTPAANYRRCHWHLQQIITAVIDTCSKWPPLSLTPAANDRCCHWHLHAANDRRCHWHLHTLNYRRYYWHLQQITVAVIDTAYSKLPPLSLTPAANYRRCHWHLHTVNYRRYLWHLQHITTAVIDTRANLLPGLLTFVASLLPVSRQIWASKSLEPVVHLLLQMSYADFRK